MTVRLIPALIWSFLRALLRDPKVRTSLWLTPLIAFGFLVLYKVTLFRDVSFAQNLVGQAVAVAVVDDGRALPGLGLDAAAAVERLNRNPRVAARLAGPEQAAALLAAKEVELIVLGDPAQDAVLLRGPVDKLRTADMVRDTLLHGGALAGPGAEVPSDGNPASAAGPPPGARFDVRIVGVPQDTKSGLVQFAAFYIVLGIATFCFTTGAVGFVAETRKGQLRGFALTPAGRGTVLVSHAVAIALIAVAQACLLLVALKLTGEAGQASVALFLGAALVSALMLTAVSYALLSFKPVDDEKGAAPLMLIVVFLSAMHFGYASGKSEEPTDSPDPLTILNPFGSLTELLDVSLTGRPSVQPLEWSLAMVAVWTLIGLGVAWFRVRYALEPDWTKRG